MALPQKPRKGFGDRGLIISGKRRKEIMELRKEAFVEMYNKPPGSVTIRHLGREDIFIGRTNSGTVVLNHGQVEEFKAHFGQLKKRPSLPDRVKANEIALKAPIGKIIFFSGGVLVRAKNGGVSAFSEALSNELARFMAASGEITFSYSGWVFEKRLDGIYFLED
ncbi:MAG: hypothetical protein AABW99_00550 [archaeon]